MAIATATAVASAVLLAGVAPSRVQADPALVSASRGVAVGGHDVVAFFQVNSSVLGHPDHAIMWRGAIWRFASTQNQQQFEANPRAYAPQFGGYCAYALSQGYLAPGNPSLWVIADGRLYLLNNANALTAWTAERPALIVAAQGNWPRVLQR
ncbi:YHS domain-containing (seleno)protein [Phaeobacter porticola]|uniref:YHS domain-containing (seleno)protein n=1 Tax=Phaeobacter porticola TaxID=1844006 RepID=UPI001F2855E5|nr:YHS domain-containing (seleno)protein [Phaeobacter porticola]